MRLKKTTRVALQILIASMRSPNAHVRIEDIAKVVGIPRQNMVRITQRLSRAGITFGVRGPRGGVKLARPAGEITVGEVVHVMENYFLGREATLVKGMNERSEEDGVQELLDLALQAYMQVLNEYTLADIARDARATPNVE